MNSWLIFALGAPLCWGFANVLDGALRRHFVKNDLALTGFLSLLKLPVAVLFFYLGGFEFPAFGPVALLMLAGLLWTLPFVLYYKAIELEEPSRIALLLQLTPLVTLLLAFLLIGETLNVNQGAAFLLLIVGAMLASLKKGEGHWRLSRALALMVFAITLWALSDVWFKSLEPQFDSFYTAFGVYNLGSFLVSLLCLLFPNRKKVLAHFSGLSRRGRVILFSDSVIGTLGSLSFAYALTLGKASLTTALIGVQPLIVFFTGLLLARCLPEFDQEAKDRTSLLLKGLALIFIIAGLLLL